MCQLKWSIQYALMVLFAIFSYSNLKAHQYFPLLVGNEWVYENKKTGQKLELKLVNLPDVDRPQVDQRPNNPNQGQRPNMPNQRPKPNPPNQGQRPNNPKQIQPPMLPNNGLLLEARLSQKLLTSRAIYMESGSLNQIFLRTSQNNFIFGLDQLFLSSRLTVGSQWSAKSQGRNRGCSLETKWKVEVIETVQVAAGKFRSLRIKEEDKLLNCQQQKLNPKNTIQHIWYASQLGPIKITFLDGQIYELAEFKSALAVKASAYKLTTSWAKLKRQ